MGLYPNWLFPNNRAIVPKPPDLPKYDPTVEAPKWNWSKMWYSVDLIEQHPEKPKTGGVPISDDKPDWRGIIKKNIVPLTPPERYNFGAYSPESYFWFDTPDYADPFKKMKFALYFMTKYGLMGTSLYAVVFGYPFDYKHIGYLLRKPFARFWIGGMTASLTVLTLANLRGNVDDHYNYLFGGLAAGAVVGRKNHMSFLRQTFIWTITSVTVKYNAETNGKLLPAFDFRNKNHGLASASGGDYGLWSGDLRVKYFRFYPEDTGRAMRTHPAG